MKIIQEKLPLRCKKCKSVKNHDRCDGRMIYTVCDECGNESITDFLPEPEPVYEQDEFKSWTAQAYREF
jgi:hypothetical protein